MSADIKTFEKIKALTAQAKNFGEFHSNFDEEFGKNAKCDKKGYGFGKDNRFGAFQIKTTFDSWAGYFGDSSCSRVMIVNNIDLIEPLIIKAINIHQKEVFQTAARLMREEAASMTGRASEELSVLQRILDDAVSDVGITDETQ